MTANEIMMNVLFKVVSMTADVEPVNPDDFFSNEDYVEKIHLMALNSYFEAGGESFHDKISAAQSVINRRNDESGEFRNHDDVRSIITRARRDSNGNPIRHKCWYSWYCDGKDDVPNIYFPNGDVNTLEVAAWEQSVIAAFMVYEDLYPNLIGDSTHYFNPDIALPDWVNDYNEYGMVGAHVFYEQQ